MNECIQINLEHTPSVRSRLVAALFSVPRSIVHCTICRPVGPMTGNDLYEQLYHGLVESVRHKCSRPQEGYRRVLYVLATLSGEHVRAYTSSESKL